jgi:glycosyl hydrolase family 16
MALGRGLATIALVGLSPLILIPSASATIHPDVNGCATPAVATHEPSHQAPPGADWLRGYARSYCNDFPGTSLPPGWGRFRGVPHGDPSGMFDPSHVVVAHGMLSLNTLRDQANGGGWASGGVCQCGVGRLYGAYFVRSRLTGAGDDEVQMLWPVANVWPPEIDFNETGNRMTKTAWYVHFRSSGHQIARTLQIDLARWHTWGVRWTPRLITFTVDGRVWGTVRSASVIPHEPMTLDLSQQTWCGIAPECPQRPVSMLVDWVAEYAPA